ncbi:MAG: hypothetical protein DKM50_08795 [Candidatus Margulisiibacteriota bacterium]|nr:MAG: hypothetical protein A2X43_04375 [Candidatus Margulisbacteria bacterium GWD2_39_127]OGI04055.1 MAG: hypothetical protein A2X42_11125 [Candidatus Margulisbacteria bacterium GWF2_38_17]OGI05998.1 MAG: hypothetical protein A2X41_12300 [Candidatus Margulisbacteria bacterium GWE2_39_32]PZM79547.1 MAG: hypothetical protein DKM50_08795 [Candidatus Margulisiibacteriota bacterium]HAR63402.1 hypothetical protein [Candidatus Margulisiibacteriota bacterium]
MKFLEFWQLKHKPFEFTKDSQFFYESKGHGEALARLFYLIEDKNMNIGLLTGEIGCGKTMTWTFLVNQINRDEYKIAVLDFSSFTFEDILKEVIAQISKSKLNPDKEYSKYELTKRFREIVIEEIAKEDKHLTIILDEAQQVSDGCLDELKNLTNIASENNNYMTIILVGQPELREKLKKLPQIYQRISLMYHLNCLEPDEVDEYIKHRLKIAGKSQINVFTKEAVNIIMKSSDCIPRNINKICKLAFDRAFALGVKVIDEDMITTIVHDFHKQDI